MTLELLRLRVELRLYHWLKDWSIQSLSAETELLYIIKAYTWFWHTAKLKDFPESESSYFQIRKNLSVYKSTSMYKKGQNNYEYRRIDSFYVREIGRLNGRVTMSNFNHHFSWSKLIIHWKWIWFFKHEVCRKA